MMTVRKQLEEDNDLKRSMDGTAQIQEEYDIPRSGKEESEAYHDGCCGNAAAFKKDSNNIDWNEAEDTTLS